MLQKRELTTDNSVDLHKIKFWKYYNLFILYTADGPSSFQVLAVIYRTAMNILSFDGHFYTFLLVVSPGMKFLGWRICLCFWVVAAVVQLLSLKFSLVEFSFQLFVTPRTAASQASLPLTLSWSLPRFMSIESVMLDNSKYCLTVS